MTSHERAASMKERLQAKLFAQQTAKEDPMMLLAGALKGLGEAHNHMCSLVEARFQELEARLAALEGSDGREPTDRDFIEAVRAEEGDPEVVTALADLEIV